MATIIMNTFLLIILLYVTAYIANLSAYDDYEQIKKHEYINHKVQWLVRAILIFLSVVCLTLIHNLVFPNLWIIIVYYSLAAAFWFSMIFRYKLNTLRGLSIYYISKSNIYDSIFIALANKNGGKLAYIFELTATIVFSILSLM